MSVVFWTRIVIISPGYDLFCVLLNMYEYSNAVLRIIYAAIVVINAKVPGLSGTYQPQTFCVGWYVPVADFRARASIGWYIPASVVSTEQCGKLKILSTTQEFELFEFSTV